MRLAPNLLSDASTRTLLQNSLVSVKLFCHVETRSTFFLSRMVLHDLFPIDVSVPTPLSCHHATYWPLWLCRSFTVCIYICIYEYLRIIIKYLWTYCNAGLALQASAPVATFNPVRWESSPLSSSLGAGPAKPRNLPKGKCGHTHLYFICLSVHLQISSNIYILIDLAIFLPIHLSLTLPSKYLSGYTCTLCFFGYYPVPTHHATAGQLHAYTERERGRDRWRQS